MKNLDEVIKTLDLYLVKKAPALPKNVKVMIVEYSPWITLIVLVLSLPALLAVFGFGSVMTYGIFRAVLGPSYYISLMFLFITVVLQGMSIKGLMAKSIKGWNLVFYSILVNAIYSLLSGNLVGLIVGTLVSLYFVFQVKEYYK